MIELTYGEVSEWFKVAASKTAVGETLPRVQIPPSPFLIEKYLLRVNTLCKLIPTYYTRITQRINFNKICNKKARCKTLAIIVF